MVSIVLADDHLLVRAGIKAILEQHGGFNVVAEAADGLEAIAMVREHKPDLLLLDLSMPKLSGLEVARRLAEHMPEQKVAILSAHTEQPFPKQILATGAMGYLGKGCEADELIRGVHAILSGERFISSEIAQAVAISLIPGGEKSPFDELSPKEMEIALALLHEPSVKAVAARMNMAYKTVSTHKGRLLRKMGLKSMVELTRLAMKWGMLPVVDANDETGDGPVVEGDKPIGG